MADSRADDAKRAAHEWSRGTHRDPQIPHLAKTGCHALADRATVVDRHTVQAQHLAPEHEGAVGAWPSQETLAADMGIPPSKHAGRTVRRATGALVAAGKLVVVDRRHRHMTHVYLLADEGKVIRVDEAARPDCNEGTHGDGL